MPVRSTVTGPPGVVRSPLRSANCSMPSAQAISSGGGGGPAAHQLPFASASACPAAVAAPAGFAANGSPWTYRPSAVSGNTCR